MGCSNFQEAVQQQAREGWWWWWGHLHLGHLIVWRRGEEEGGQLRAKKTTKKKNEISCWLAGRRAAVWSLHPRPGAAAASIRWPRRSQDKEKSHHHHPPPPRFHQPVCLPACHPGACRVTLTTGPRRGKPRPSSGAKKEAVRVMRRRLASRAAFQ